MLKLRGGHLASDLGIIFRVGLPLIINNVSSIGVTVADTLMASTLGATQLAAVAIGSGIWIALFLLGLGTIMAIGPTVAQHFGAGRGHEIGDDTRQGFWLGLVISVIIVVAMRSIEPLLLMMGIATDVCTLAQGYLDALSWGVFAAYAYHTLKQMSEGVGRTVPIMVVMAVALPINIALNYTFMLDASVRRSLARWVAVSATGSASGSCSRCWRFTSVGRDTIARSDYGGTGAGRKHAP